jgi:glutamate carboxypeptidase
MAEADAILAWMQARQGEMLAWIRGLVEIESPSRDEAAVSRAADYVAEMAGGLGAVARTRLEGYGDLLRIEPEAPGDGKDGQVLGLGHLDTVYPVGTLATMPCREADGRLWGPGVFDMKAGVAYFLFAARALRELGVPVRRSFVLQLNPEEEIGSPASRPFTEAEARKSAAVLVAEPAYGLDGSVKTARKGGGTFTLKVEGKASHAGLDFAAGASAVVEIARQIDRVAGWTDLESGVTVNPGVVRGGTGSNVVAAKAEAVVDVRVPRADQALELEARFRSLQPFDARTRLRVEGGLRRPPMERSAGAAALYEKARAICSEWGVELGEASVGGGSDGNFTAAMGVPTLDGLGAVGEGAHSTHESILLDHVADRAALIARLIAEV